VLALRRAHTAPVAGPAPPSDRYEPLPGFAELPGWLWRRLGRRVRIGAVVALLLAAGGTAALVPSIGDTQRERSAAEDRRREALREQRIRELRAEQRPVSGRTRSTAQAGAGPRVRLAARAAAMDDLTAAIAADARRRVRAGALAGPIRRVECEPFPRTVGGADPAEQLSRRSGRYACVAVTAEFERTEESVGGALGHPYRAMIDFESGRYAFCKIAGRTDPTHNRQVTTPSECGG
jgi:hypothetical protein